MRRGFLARGDDVRAAPAGFRGPLCLFSKHLPSLEAQPLARAVKSLGFAGIDLTVRPGGHVTPERAAEDLPRFLDAVRDEGVEVPMITTALVSASEPTARPILETAGAHGVALFKPGYYRYAFADVRKELADAAAALRGLAELGARYGVALGFHNHAGYIGGRVWDVVPILDALDPRWAGYYFDVRHAVVEGGDGGWRSALERRGPAIEDDRGQGLLLGEGAQGLAAAQLPAGRGHGGLEGVLRRARAQRIRGAGVAPPRIRDPRRDGGGEAGGDAGGGGAGPGAS